MLFRLFCNPDHRIFLVLGLIAAFAAGPVGMADPVLSREEQRAGFRMLFNGRNLDGWMEIQGRAGTFWESRRGLSAVISRPSRPPDSATSSMIVCDSR